MTDEEKLDRILNDIKNLGLNRVDMDRGVEIGFDKNISLFFMIWEMIPEEVKNELFNLVKTMIKKIVEQSR